MTDPENKTCRKFSLMTGARLTAEIKRVPGVWWKDDPILGPGFFVAYPAGEAAQILQEKCEIILDRLDKLRMCGVDIPKLDLTATIDRVDVCSECANTWFAEEDNDGVLRCHYCGLPVEKEGKP